MTARVKAEAAGAERNDLQKATRHRDILEEVDELVLIAQLVVECQSRCDREYGKDGGRPTGMKSQDESNRARDLDDDRDRQRGLRQMRCSRSGLPAR